MIGNSPLVVYVKLSTFCTVPRNQPITKLTPHHVAGNATVETVGAIFTTPGRNASCHYSVGSDGRRGLHCEEKNRSWCSSSAANDNAAITFEIANNSGAPGWSVSDKAWESFIELAVDCILRNPGIKRKDGRPGLYCDGTPNASLTFHRYFSATGCASPWIWDRRFQLCDEVNRRLDAIAAKTASAPTLTVVTTPPATTTPAAVASFKVGDVIKLAANATYYDGKAMPAWVVNDRWLIHSMSGDRVVLGKNVAGTSNIMSAVNLKFLQSSTTVAVVPAPAFQQYRINAPAGTTYRKGAGTNYIVVGTIANKGIFTIIEEKRCTGNINWGRLASGAGWVRLDTTTKAA